MFTYPIEDGPYWQIQEAKAMFSKVIRSAGQQPQIITVHGKESAVVLSMDAYKKLTSPEGSLVSFMEQSPWASAEIKLPQRHSEKMRGLNL